MLNILLSIFGEIEMINVAKRQQINHDLRNIGIRGSKEGIVCCLFWKHQTLLVLQK